MNTVTVFDDRICNLGEGVLWHPKRQQLFWFDIIGKRLLSQTSQGKPLSWQFDEHVSVAGWVDQQQLLIACESSLFLFNVENEQQKTLCELEAGNTMTRSNDGRADQWGGFWIGTMGKQAEKDAGAIYRFYRGELRQLVAPVTIPNAICFSPDRQWVYFADTTKATIWKQALDSEHGWPIGEKETFIDCAKAGVYPDGAVTDSAGNLWNAQWGASRVACYNPNGDLTFSIDLPTQHISCPAFGGKDLSTLYVTTATQGLKDLDLMSQDKAGSTFSVSVPFTGRLEPAVIIE